MSVTQHANHAVLAPGSLLAWIVLGLLAGWTAGKITRGRGFGCLKNLAIGLVGAVIGGFIFSALGFRGPAGFLTSLVVSIVGTAVLLLIGNAIAD